MPFAAIYRITLPVYVDLERVAAPAPLMTQVAHVLLGGPTEVTADAILEAYEKLAPAGSTPLTLAGAFVHDVRPLGLEESALAFLSQEVSE